jgi:hypothetical protein
MEIRDLPEAQLTRHELTHSTARPPSTGHRSPLASFAPASRSQPAGS